MITFQYFFEHKKYFANHATFLELIPISSKTFHIESASWIIKLILATKWKIFK